MPEFTVREIEVVKEPIIVIEESYVENVRHHKAIVKETKAVKHAPVKKPEFRMKEVAALGEPIIIIEEA